MRVRASRVAVLGLPALLAALLTALLAALLAVLTAGPVSGELWGRERSAADRTAGGWTSQASGVLPGQQRWFDEQHSLPSTPSRQQRTALLGPATVEGRDVLLRVVVSCTDGLVEVGASVTQQTADGRPVTGVASSAPTACSEVRLLVPAPATAFVPGPAFVTLRLSYCRADRCEEEQVISSVAVQEAGREQDLLAEPTVQLRPVQARVDGRARPLAHVPYRCEATPQVHSATAQLYVRGADGLVLLSGDRPGLRCDGQAREVTFRRSAAGAPPRGQAVLVITTLRCHEPCGGSAATGSRGPRYTQ